MSPPFPISACVITLNEEANLAACLESLAFCAEAVVVDCGSTDRTVEVAREAGARVVHRDWTGVADQKNHAVAAACYDLVLCLDADERVSPALRASIEALFAAGPCAPGYAMAWRTIYLGTAIHSDRGRARWKTRLYDRRRGRWTGPEPHAHVEVEGQVVRLAGFLDHHTVRDLTHQVEKTNLWTSSAAAAMEAGRRSPLVGAIVRAPWAFVRTYVFRGGFLDGRPGLVGAVLSAYYVFLKYAKLRERRRRSRGP